MWEYKATCTRVVDGDTLDLRIDLGFTVSVDVRVRLARVNTPEVHGVKRDSEEYARGKEASEFVRNWLDLDTTVEPRVVVRTKKTGKYGRWIAEIADASGRSLNDELIAQGWGS